MDAKRKHRVVVKIGSSSLTNPTGGLSRQKLEEHVSALAALRRAGHEVILVSSGAVATGFTQLGYPSRPVTLEGKQAAAAVGQGLLIQAYNDSLRTYGLSGAQILLTRDDFSKRHRYQNTHNALNELLKRGILPIINENDCVAVDELTFGDNDMLSALVAGFLRADDLIILTDTDGLYDADPRTNPQAKKFTLIEEITPEIEAIAGGTGSRVGTGGMRSKINAAKFALSLGIHVFIGTGKGAGKLLDILAGKGEGTYFRNDMRAPLKARKQWIAFHAESDGRIVIDKGAARALLYEGKSLLPSGIVRVCGDFSAGQVVEVTDLSGRLLGKGEVNYSAAQLEQVKGESTAVCREQLGVLRVEAVHRDNWVTLYINENKEEHKEEIMQ
ncbi:glutamate 5-kinase [Aneurinibacillus thermoaerophilus]|uniref:glutamate 5-kinase n=1 Tax=Aneurinibacillus TaxID=55079 RepID=UPI00070D883F|nr:MULTISPECIES: glutamate 5-kinase [Aneurinibacillus]AMA71920.1 glutamate 5-kinase [Aneurinibacillus sp. XH2]MED0675529.1 glutamate 5-kinase [Aneurinibacillus thermoaerophilus]MED0757353.1 glutamate 5-kinase [Aneurinibacillus thermoaerophilus]MED0762110.1 glutamate 5-kinase [Aneurinibacillus thermoaerophilus]